MNDLIQSLTLVKRHAQCSTSPFPFVHLYIRIILKEIKVIMQNIFDSGVDSALILGRTVPVYNEQTAGANKGSWCMGLMAPSTRFRTFLKLHSS